MKQTSMWWSKTRKARRMSWCQRERERKKEREKEREREREREEMTTGAHEIVSVRPLHHFSRT